ncbi:MAG TPA: hypothetical protein VMY36_02850 [Patescibacteria group bacterium]|nr:hypothetical protein [Patescibacteria group bacterium]
MSIKKENILNFFKRYWLFILLATIVVSLLAIRFIYRPTSPSSQPLPTPQFGSLSQPQSELSQPLGKEPIYDVLLSENDFASFPKSLAVYQIKKFAQEEILSRLSKMIVDLGFLGTPEEQQRKEGNFLIWREEENYLKVNLSSGQFSFIGKSPLVQNQTTSSTKIGDLVAEKIKTWGLTASKPEVEVMTGFVPVGMELNPVINLDQATIFNITFKSSLNGYPLVGIGQVRNLLEAKVDNQGNLLNLFFSLHQTDQEVISQYPLKSYEEVINEIKEGQAQIIELMTESGDYKIIPFPEEIREVKISSVSIAYYETTEVQEYHQPVFLLKGDVTLRDSNRYQAVLTLPAISSEYLKPTQEHF